MAPESADRPDKLVLIADDDIGVLRFLKMAVENEGFRVETATNGPDTLQKVGEKKPDLIILDLMMPGFGGFEILRRLKESAASETPIIIVTGRRMDLPTQQIIRSEASVKEFLSKPIRLPSLRAAIGSAFKTTPPDPKGPAA